MQEIVAQKRKWSYTPCVDDQIRRSAFHDEQFLKNFWRQAMTIKVEGMTPEEVANRMLELARRDTLLLLKGQEILARFLRSVEHAATLEDVRAITADTRAQLGNTERLELLAGADLIEDKALAPVIDTLINTAFKWGEHEKW